MSEKKEQDKDSFLKWLDGRDPFEEDEISITIFKCIDCGKEDEVPDDVVEEFHFDLDENEEVKVHCPFCGGTMLQARNVPSE